MEKDQWHWPINGISSSRLEQFKSSTEEFLRREYGSCTEENYAKMIDDHYRDFLRAVRADQGMPIDEEQIQSSHQKMMEMVNDALFKRGMSAFNFSYMGQGWFSYIDWKLNRQ